MPEQTPPHPANAITKCPVALAEVDLFSPGAQEYWFDAYRILHEQAPVLRIPGEGAFPGTDGFVITKYEDIAAIIADPHTYPQPTYGASMVSDGPKRGAVADAMARNTLRPTMELHKQHRIQLTDPWVGATGAPRHREMITRTVDQLIGEWVDDGEVEFVSQFAAKLPQIVMTNILGFPLEDMPRLKTWGEAQVRRFVYGTGHRNLLPPEDERENAVALGEFMAYVQDQVTRKRANPGDDMTTFLSQVEYMGRKLTDQEVIGVIFGMHIGGLETTQYALAAEAQILAEQPELMAEVRADRSKIRFFVEESLRVQAPTQGLSTRMAGEDVEIRGVKIAKGSILHLRYGAGNRDPEEFECPEQVNIERPTVGRHLTFSQGPRVCPGAGLSRLEQNIAWDRLMDRIERFEFTPGKNDFSHQPGIMLGLWELHLRFTKAT